MDRKVTSTTKPTVHYLQRGQNLARAKIKQLNSANRLVARAGLLQRHAESKHCGPQCLPVLGERGLAFIEEGLCSFMELFCPMHLVEDLETMLDGWQHGVRLVVY
jgi:hypothetical protein